MFKNENAFTLIEMLIVLLIISILILLIVPNLTNKSKNIHTKGCEALVELVQSQVIAYELDNGQLPSSLSDLVTNNYVKSNQLTCENNYAITMDRDGNVSYEKQ